MNEPLREAMRAADTFLRWAHFHVDRPRPEMLEKCRLELMEALKGMADDPR